MNSDNFKKIVYGTAVLSLVSVIYFGLMRKTSNGDSATKRLATFLGIKSSSPLSVDVSNQKDLNIDSTEQNTNKAESSDAKNESAPTSDKAASLYTVKEGDTYGCIAEKYYGSFEHWTDIYNLNARYGRGFSEYYLHVDAVLELPAISAENLKPATKLCS